MQAVIQHVGTDEEAVKSKQATRHIAASKMPVLPSKTLTAHERLNVYREMYWMRLREALAIDYPELKQYLGDDQFDLLCDSYVQEYPSRSYSLNRLGDHLPKFLSDGGFDGLKRRGFVTELARLELLMTEVFDDVEVPVLDEAGVARVPADAWETIKLQPIAALRHLPMRYPVSEYLSALRNKKPADGFLTRKDSWVVVFRRGYGVQRLELNRTAYRLFTALISGVPLGDAVSNVRVSPAQLQEWFKLWVSNRLFRAIP
jgi:hypothetical protein